MNNQISPSVSDTANGALSPSELMAGMDAFDAHYQLAEGQSVPGQLAIPFQQLQDKIYSFMQAEKLPEDEVACRFIHRFDTAKNRCYVCLELARMTDQHRQDAYGREEYEVTGYAAYRYDIMTDVQASTFQGSYDVAYFNHLFYIAVAGAGQPQALVYGQHVQSVVVPWMRELLRLCQHNDLEGVAGAKIVLQSIASQPAYTADALVKWPHSIAFYMRDAQGHDCLGEGSKDFIFKNQAADMAQPCPASCKEYYMPVNLPV